MKSFKLVPIFICFIIALSSAFATANRATFTYVNKCPGYVRISGPCDPAKCVTPDAKACCYTVSVDLGPNPSEADILAAGGVPSAMKRCYAL